MCLVGQIGCLPLRFCLCFWLLLGGLAQQPRHSDHPSLLACAHHSWAERENSQLPDTSSGLDHVPPPCTSASTCCLVGQPAGCGTQTHLCCAGCGIPGCSGQWAAKGLVVCGCCQAPPAPVCSPPPVLAGAGRGQGSGGWSLTVSRVALWAKTGPIADQFWPAGLAFDMSALENRRVLDGRKRF